MRVWEKIDHELIIVEVVWWVNGGLLYNSIYFCRFQILRIQKWKKNLAHIIHFADTTWSTWIHAREERRERYLQHCVKDITIVSPTLLAGKTEQNDQNVISQSSHTLVMYCKGNEWDFSFEEGVEA